MYACLSSYNNNLWTKALKMAANFIQEWYNCICCVNLQKLQAPPKAVAKTEIQFIFKSVYFLNPDQS